MAAAPSSVGEPATRHQIASADQARPPAERFRERLIYRAYLAGERVINALPRRLALIAASALGNVAYDLGGTKRGVVRDNLARAMGIDPSDARAARAARRAFRNYAKYLVDVMRMPTLTDATTERLVRVENIECLAEARAGGTGVLICAVHVGGMDLMGPGLLRHGESLQVVADDTSYGRLYDHLKEVRARHGLHLIGWRNLRGLFRALRAGENLVLFCDGGFRRGDVPVEFLGEATTFPAGPASLSAKTGAPILPVHCLRTPDDRFVARGLPTIRAASSEPAELQRATQELADALGTVIAADPGQWYMFRSVWPQTDEDRAVARETLAVARRGEDWTRWR